MSVDIQYNNKSYMYLEIREILIKYELLHVIPTNKTIDFSCLC